MNAMPPAPQIFMGRRIVIMADTRTVRRSWRERWLSWPWRPLERTKVVPNDLLPAGDDVLLIDGAWHMKASTWRALQQHLERQVANR